MIYLRIAIATPGFPSKDAVPSYEDLLQGKGMCQQRRKPTAIIFVSDFESPIQYGLTGNNEEGEDPGHALAASQIHLCRS